MQNEILIEARGIGVRRLGRAVLENVSLEVRARDFVTIVGPNGAGKSYLLGCLVGAREWDEGTITMKEGLRVGYMPQRVMLSAMIPMRVRDFLTVRLAPHQKFFDETIARIGLADCLDKSLHHLSGGEWQRMLLGRALLREPELLILDEPAQNLDVASQWEFYALLERLFKERAMSILMVSHDVHFVMSCTKRVVCLYHHVCCTGTPQAVRQHPEFTALFGKAMAKHMAVYQHHHDHRHD